MIPSTDIENILFSGPVDTTRLMYFSNDSDIVNNSDFSSIHWLNTPGPVYTGFTDNCGTGQVSAMNNVGGDRDYHEVIFKQPCTNQELDQVLEAAAVDPFGAYYFDGNRHWTKELIIEWWSKSTERINYILECYHYELNLPDILDRPLYGPREPVPENYKNWLDFYQTGMKMYLEWYILRLGSQETLLPALEFDWHRKEQLDDRLKAKRYNG